MPVWLYGSSRMAVLFVVWGKGPTDNPRASSQPWPDDLFHMIKFFCGMFRAGFHGNSNADLMERF